MPPLLLNLYGRTLSDAGHQVPRQTLPGLARASGGDRSSTPPGRINILWRVNIQPRGHKYKLLKFSIQKAANVKLQTDKALFGSRVLYNLKPVSGGGGGVGNGHQTGQLIVIFQCYHKLLVFLSCNIFISSNVITNIINNHIIIIWEESPDSYSSYFCFFPICLDLD